MADIPNDTKVWVPDPDENVYYAAGKTVKKTGDKYTVLKDSGETLEFPAKDVFMRNPPDYDGMEDMTTLLHLSEAALLRNLSYRFGGAAAGLPDGPNFHLIYTYVGGILIAVNPFKRGLAIYRPAMMNNYRKCVKNEVAPHAYAIADAAYTNMTTWKKSQSITISGESGAGKTETTKIMMSYLSNVGGSLGVGALEDAIMQANPILEATGNSKTLRNNNSSRFGKFTMMQFDKSFQLVGASVNQYLLEKSRVVFQAKNERNYHVFYQLLKGADAKMKSDYNLGSADPNDFHYLNQSFCTEIDGVSDGAEFQDTWNAMKTCGFSDVERETCWRMWAGILHLGNCKFTGSDKAALRDKAPMESCAKMLQCDPVVLERCLVKYRMKVGADWIEKDRKEDDAAASRDALAKAIYARMFVYLVEIINKVLAHFEKMANFCGVLDIFGFENFEHGNSFEQLCINLANEKLQQFFNQHVFKLEQQLYKDEQLNVGEIPFEDNQLCLDLIELKGGVLAMLDEECVVPNGSDKGFCEKLWNTYDKKNKYFSKPKPSSKKGASTEVFNIVHYAGTVTYDCKCAGSWLEKNNDTLHPDFAMLLTGSKDAFVAAMFVEKEEAAASGKAKSKFKSVAGQFKASLASLMEILSTSQPHFVRCIKPNPEKTERRIDNKSVSEQLRSGGVLEAVKIQIAGWPVKMPHADFCKRYKNLKPKVKDADPKVWCDKLLRECGYAPDSKVKQLMFAVGKTRVFFRAGGLDAMEDKLNHLQAAQLHGLIGAQSRAIVKIQATWKMFVSKRRFKKLRGNLKKLFWIVKC